MNIFPNLKSYTILMENELPLYEEWAYDFERNELLMRDGFYYKIYGAEALKVWIYKALNTERYRFQAYSHSFGSELEELIGLSTDKEVFKSELERRIEETLLVNPYINGVTDFQHLDNSTISFIVNTVYGDTNAALEGYYE